MGIFGALSGGRNGQRIANEYRNTYARNFGCEPPSEALEHLASAATIIGSFSGSGKTTLGAQRLDTAIESFASVVGYNGFSLACGEDEPKILFALALLMGLCTKPSGKVLHGYEWAYRVIAQKAQRYCPATWQRSRG